jgi:hypothetical protein
MDTTALEPLTRLAEDARTAAVLLPDDEPLRAYVEMLGALPPDPGAWLEVIEPHLEDAQRGRLRTPEGRGVVAAVGALGVAALHAARELPPGEALTVALTHAARWCFFLVRPAAA